MEGDFSLAKDPLFFQTEGEEHAALGKKPMELAAAGENNYLKRCM